MFTVFLHSTGAHYKQHAKTRTNLHVSLNEQTFYCQLALNYTDLD